jgi:hypothetical protein
MRGTSVPQKSLHLSSGLLESTWEFVLTCRPFRTLYSSLQRELIVFQIRLIAGNSNFWFGRRDDPFQGGCGLPVFLLLIYHRGVALLCHPMHRVLLSLLQPCPTWFQRAPPLRVQLGLHFMLFGDTLLRKSFWRELQKLDVPWKPFLG